MKHAYSVVVGILEGKMPLGKARCHEEGSIEMDFKAM